MGKLLRGCDDEVYTEIGKNVSKHYEDIVRVLTDYEYSDGRDCNVNEEMYRLLVRIQNCIEV